MCVLERCPNVESYALFDVSQFMLGLSRDRLARFPAARFVNADFRTAEWTRSISPPYSAVIAMQAVHEIRHQRHAPGLYRQIRNLLVPNGLIAVCDGTPHDGSELWRTSLLMTPEEQLHALASAGFLGAVLDRSSGAMVFATGRRGP